MPTSRTLHIDGHTIGALSFNEDQPGLPQAVFLHGIMSSLRFWVAGQTPIFTERFTWHALSLPGHYPGAFPPGFCRADLTPETITDVLAGAIRQLTGGQPALIVGHSTGGFAAVALAARHPELVQAVISVSGFAHGRWTGVLGLMQGLARAGLLGDALFRANLRLMASSRALFQSSATLYTADRDAFASHPLMSRTIDTLYEDTQQLDSSAMAHYFARMPDIDITGWLPKVSAPLLAITGDHDPIVPPQQSSLIAGHVQHGELTVLRGSGHVPMAERDAEYVAAVTAWAERLEAGDLAPLYA